MGAATAKRPACPECGSDVGVYAAIDVRWDSTFQRWELNGLREPDDGQPLDCTQCDHRFQLEDGGFPDPCEHVVERVAVIAPDVALTAMVLWEAVLDWSEGEDAPWFADRENEGTCALRDRMLSLAPQCDSDWEFAQAHMGFDAPFDWEFAPQWLRHNYGHSFTTPAERLAWLQEGN